jgi:hypothetical protein
VSYIDYIGPFVSGASWKVVPMWKLFSDSCFLTFFDSTEKGKERMESFLNTATRTEENTKDQLCFFHFLSENAFLNGRAWKQTRDL